jgi:hypothetical protein
MGHIWVFATGVSCGVPHVKTFLILRVFLVLHFIFYLSTFQFFCGYLLNMSSATFVRGAVATALPVQIDDDRWKVTMQHTDGTFREVILQPVEDEEDGESKPEEPKVSENSPSQLRSFTDRTSQGSSRRLKIYLFVQQILTTIFSLSIIAVMVLTIQKYNSSKSVSGAWPKNPFLTPTFVMLAMATLTCIMDLTLLTLKCCSEERAAKANKFADNLKIAIVVIQALGTIASSGFFKWASLATGNRDLWSWSCTDAADKFASVNFSGALCLGNVSRCPCPSMPFI